MSVKRPGRAALAAGLIVVCPLIAAAQQPAPDPVSAGADIVLTPSRSPQAIQRAGSAITVIRGEDIEKAPVRSTADIFRAVPGVFVTEDGGPGQAARLRIRGGEARHTLVLVDGMRANDPSNGAAEFDLNTLVAGDIERIEVLRGPQSALYGSDALGGVVNIITRKGRGGPKFSAGIESGSYGTTSGRAAVSGGTADFDYALSLAGSRGAGFSAYGYRIGRITSALARPLENDAFQRLGGAMKFAWRPAEGIEIETGLTSSFNRAQYDAAYYHPLFSTEPDTENRATSRLTTAYTRLSATAFDGTLKNALTLYANHSSRNYDSYTYFNFGFGIGRGRNIYDYTGQRFGAEYQGDLSLGAFGKLTFGGGLHEDRLETRSRNILLTTIDRETARQQTRSLFALYQLPVGERFDLSLGGRYDDVGDGERFLTWRATGAYRIAETGTKLRASAGTGGKAPSLFQRYSPLYGTRTLESEKAIGVDAGIDQTLLGGRLALSATGFATRLTNLIDFSFGGCPPAQPFGCYLNVGRANMSGVELSANAVLIEGMLTARASYTHLSAVDERTDKRLARRPEHSGVVSLNFKPFEGFTIEPSVRLVGERFSSTGETQRLAPYARFDVSADYRLNKEVALFVRGENLTNARYQEVYDYGTAGRSVYLGLRGSW